LPKKCFFFNTHSNSHQVDKTKKKHTENKQFTVEYYPEASFGINLVKTKQQHQNEKRTNNHRPKINRTITNIQPAHT